MNRKPIIDEQLRENYESAHYQVIYPSISIIVGKKSDVLDVLLIDNNVFEGTLITAYNPGSQLKSNKENLVKQHALRAAIEKMNYTIINGVSKDPKGKWPVEPQFFVFGISLNRAKALARSFGQAAILHHQLNQATELVFV